MVILGLTGGIGSGKSTISKMLSEKGAIILDADVYAREVVAPGSSVLAELSHEFGEEILLPDGRLDRKSLAERAFLSDETKDRLDRIMYKAIRQRYNERLRELKLSGFDGVAVIDAPLLYTAGLDKLADIVWVVRVPPAERIERVLRRLGAEGNPAEIAKRIERQKREEELHKNGDLFIDNSGSIEELQLFVNQAWDNLKPLKA